MENGRAFLGRCGYAGIPKVCSFGSWCLSGTPVTLPKCSPTNSCSGGRDLGPEGTCGYELWPWSPCCLPHSPSPRTYSCLLFPQIAETYAFLPREAVTRFLMSCTECQKRMHFNSNGLEPKGKGEWFLPAELTLHFVPAPCHWQLLNSLCWSHFLWHWPTLVSPDIFSSHCYEVPHSLTPIPAFTLCETTWGQTLSTACTQAHKHHLK